MQSAYVTFFLNGGLCVVPFGIEVASCGCLNTLLAHLKAQPINLMVVFV